MKNEGKRSHGRTWSSRKNFNSFILAQRNYRRQLNWLDWIINRLYLFTQPHLTFLRFSPLASLFIFHHLNSIDILKSNYPIVCIFLKLEQANNFIGFFRHKMYVWIIFMLSDKQKLCLGKQWLQYPLRNWYSTSRVCVSEWHNWQSGFPKQGRARENSTQESREAKRPLSKLHSSAYRQVGTT